MLRSVICQRVGGGGIPHKRCFASFSNLSESLELCKNEVKLKDFDNFVSISHTVPPKAQAAFFAIRAFNIETATVKDNVSDGLVGAMRLQWWRDTIDSIYNGDIPSQPTAKLLAAVLTRHKLRKRWFHKIIDARDNDLDSVQPLNINQVEEYSESTAGSLLSLSLEILGIHNVEANHAASHIGKAHGITTLLRSTPYHISKGSIYIPKMILLEHGMSLERLAQSVAQGSMDEEEKERLCNAVHGVASVAKSHIDHARELRSSIPNEAIPALLPAIFADKYLLDLQKVNFDVFHPDLRTKSRFHPFPTHWMVMKHKWANEY